MVVWLCGVLLKKHIDIEAYLGTLAMTRERRINMIKTIQPPCRLGTTVSVSYADTFSFRSKVNTLKPRFARGTSPPQSPPAPAPPWGSLSVGMFSDSPYLAVVRFLHKSL